MESQLVVEIVIGLLSVIGGLLGFAVSFMRAISKAVSSIKENVAVLTERTQWLHSEIGSLDTRVTKLENRTRGKAC